MALAACCAASVRRPQTNAMAAVGATCLRLGLARSGQTSKSKSVSGSVTAMGVGEIASAERGGVDSVGGELGVSQSRAHAMGEKIQNAVESGLLPSEIQATVTTFRGCTANSAGTRAAGHGAPLAPASSRKSR